MSPIVVKYLKTHSFRQLEEEHGVCARPNSSFDKFSLNYDQILAKNGDLIAEQCRGTVIRPKKYKLFSGLSGDSWKDVIVGDIRVLAWPMDRFYNLGDPAAASIDWNDKGLRVYEKLDGTMIVVYWDPLHDKWFAATRSVPEADLPIRKDHIEIGDLTFTGLFRRALIEMREGQVGLFCHSLAAEDDLDKVIDHDFDKGITYVFELTSPYNRVVVKYDEPRVTLLAARRTKTGEEVAIEKLTLKNIGLPIAWQFATPFELERFVNAADPALLEGAVVCDSQFRRVKVKNKAWVLSSRAKDLVTVSRRSALLAIIKGEIDDVVQLVEASIANELLRMQKSLRDHLHDIDKKFHDYKSKSNGSRKEFALLVKSTENFTAPYFSMWEGKATNAADWIENAAENKKLSDGTLDVLLNLIDETTV